MRFAPLCRGYGARLVGAGSGWAETPVSAIDAFRRERSLLRPAVWFVDAGTDRLAAAAEGSPRAEQAAASPGWSTLVASLKALGRDGEPIPVLPGATVLGRAAFGLDGATGADAEDALDDAAVLLAGLIRIVLEAGPKSVALVERQAGLEPAMLAGATGPVRKLLAHHRAAAWLIVEGADRCDLGVHPGIECAGTLFVDIDVRSAGQGGAAAGLGLDADVLRGPVPRDTLAAIATAARNVPVFAPVISADALPEAVLALADAVALAPAT